MSQLSTQSQDPSWVSLPFEKYSHNISRIGTKKYAWSHIGPRNDLSFVIRNVGMVDEVGNYATRIIMTISAGTEVLESQDLGELVALFQQFDPSSGAENPVQVVVRPPIWLAMVYPKSAATVQRTQYKFFSEIDFGKAVDVFTKLGLPTRESLPPRTGSVSVPPPSSSPAPSMFSVASTSTSFSAASSVSRPSSAFHVANSLNGIPVIRQFATSPFKVPQLPGNIQSSNQSSNQQRLSLLPYSAHTGTRQHSTSSNLPTSQTPASQFQLEDSVKLSSHYLSQLDRGVSASDGDTRHLSNPNPPVGQSDELNSKHWSLSTLSGSQNNDGTRSDAMRLANRSPFFSLGAEIEEESPEKPASTEAVDRPSPILKNIGSVIMDLTSPMSTGYLIDQGVGHHPEIPPRRELPFKVTAPKGEKKRSFSSADLSPLPKPTPLVRSESVIRPPTVPAPDTSTPDAKPKKRIAQRKRAVSTKIEQKSLVVALPIKPTSGEVPAESVSSQVQDEPSPLAVKSATTARPASAAPILQSKANIAPKKRAAPSRPTSSTKRPKMVDQSTQTQTFSGRDHTSAIRQSTSEVPPLVDDSPSAASPPETFLDSIDKFVTKHKHRPAPADICITPSYLAASEDEREVMLNDWICANLQNPEFQKLCEDMQFSWRRIGLGS